jgi:hypothetical protein
MLQLVIAQSSGLRNENPLVGGASGKKWEASEGNLVDGNSTN